MSVVDQCHIDWKSGKVRPRFLVNQARNSVKRARAMRSGEGVHSTVPGSIIPTPSSPGKSPLLKHDCAGKCLPLTITCGHMNDPESLVLVPGLVCDARVWRDQVAALSAAREVIVAEHGLADRLGTMAEQVLARAPPRFALAGHSMGGRVALEVLARAPQRVTRLALLDTGYEGLADGEAGERERSGRYRLRDLGRCEGMLALGREWARGMVHPARLADAALMDDIHAMIARAPLARFEAQTEALLHRPDRTALLAEVRVPTLVLCGAEDAWSPLARHQQMAARIAGATLVAVPDSGHMVTMERPAEVTQALAAWLAT